MLQFIDTGEVRVITRVREAPKRDEAEVMAAMALRGPGRSFTLDVSDSAGGNTKGSFVAIGGMCWPETVRFPIRPDFALVARAVMSEAEFSRDWPMALLVYNGEDPVELRWIEKPLEGDSALLVVPGQIWQGRSGFQRIRITKVSMQEQIVVWYIDAEKETDYPSHSTVENLFKHFYLTS